MLLISGNKMNTVTNSLKEKSFAGFNAMPGFAAWKIIKKE